MSDRTYKYRSVDVAKYMLVRASQEGIAMNMTKLQKLLYAAYGICLSVEKERLTDEVPEVWPYGPVFPGVRTKLLHVNFDQPRFSLDDRELGDIARDEDMKSLIGLVFRTFGDWTAGQLTVWSHAEDSPWEKTRSHTPRFKWGKPMNDDYIAYYFSQILDRQNDNKKGDE